MARPRTPAKVLQLRGAFRQHPERVREDAEGAGPFERDPPTHLHASIVPAWRYIVARLPQIVLTSSDEIAVEQAARCMATIWSLGDLGTVGALSGEFKKLDDSLRQWLVQLGMTPVARTKVGSANAKKAANPFDAFKGQGPRSG